MRKQKHTWISHHNCAECISSYKRVVFPFSCKIFFKGYQMRDDAKVGSVTKSRIHFHGSWKEKLNMCTCICCFNSYFLKLTWKSLNHPFFSISKGTYLNNKLPCSIHTLLEVLHTLKSDSTMARVCPGLFYSFDQLLNGCCVHC